MKLFCKGLCDQFQKIYHRGWQKTKNGCYCKTCGCFFICDSLLCPCCKKRVRRSIRQHRNPSDRNTQYLKQIGVIID